MVDTWGVITNNNRDINYYERYHGIDKQEYPVFRHTHNLDFTCVQEFLIHSQPMVSILTLDSRASQRLTFLLSFSEGRYHNIACLLGAIFSVGLLENEAIRHICSGKYSEWHGPSIVNDAWVSGMQHHGRNQFLLVL